MTGNRRDLLNMVIVKSHRDLLVWQKAMDMTVQIYQLSNSFPASEMYGLTSQMRRSAASVAANIAEGNARGTSKDYSRFLAIAKGSLMETETFLVLAIRLSYLDKSKSEPVLSLIEEISKMLTAIRQKLD